MYASVCVCVCVCLSLSLRLLTFCVTTVDGQNIQTLQHALCWTPAPQNLNVSARMLPKVMLGFDLFRPWGLMHFRLHSHWTLGARGLYRVEGVWICRPSRVVLFYFSLSLSLVLSFHLPIYLPIHVSSPSSHPSLQASQTPSFHWEEFLLQVPRRFAGQLNSNGRVGESPQTAGGKSPWCADWVGDAWIGGEKDRKPLRFFQLLQMDPVNFCVNQFLDIFGATG